MLIKALKKYFNFLFYNIPLDSSDEKIKDKKEPIEEPPNQLFLLCPECGGSVETHYEEKMMYWCISEEKHIKNPNFKIVDVRVKIVC